MIQVALVQKEDRYELGILVDGVPHGVQPYSKAGSVEEVLDELRASFQGHEVQQISVREHNRLLNQYSRNRRTN